MRKLSLYQFYLASFSLIALISCSSDQNNANLLMAPEKTACEPGAAQIMVGDGYMKNVCGCTGQGENGATYTQNSKLVCHLGSDNSTVFFYFLDTANVHQIVSTGSNDFGGSPLMEPSLNGKNWATNRVYTASFPKVSTTYTFQDVIDGLEGEIITP